MDNRFEREILQMLEDRDCEIVSKKKHRLLFVDGQPVTKFPYGSGGGFRAERNVVAQVRRFLREQRR